MAARPESEFVRKHISRLEDRIKGESTTFIDLDKCNIPIYVEDLNMSRSSKDCVEGLNDKRQKDKEYKFVYQLNSHEVFILEFFDGQHTLEEISLLLKDRFELRIDTAYEEVKVFLYTWQRDLSVIRLIITTKMERKFDCGKTSSETIERGTIPGTDIYALPVSGSYFIYSPLRNTKSFVNKKAFFVY